MSQPTPKTTARKNNVDRRHSVRPPQNLWPGISKRRARRPLGAEWVEGLMTSTKASARLRTAYFSDLTPSGSKNYVCGQVRATRQELERARRECMPGARIIIAQPDPVWPSREADAQQSPPPAQYLRQSSDGRSIFGVLQCHKDVNYSLNLPFVSDAMPARATDQLRCFLTYDPASDACEFFCNTHKVSLVGESSRHDVGKGQMQIIEPGIWTVNVSSKPSHGPGPGDMRPLTQFLLLKRAYTSELTGSSATESGETTMVSAAGASSGGMPSGTASPMETEAELIMMPIHSPEDEKIICDLGPYSDLQSGDLITVTTNPAEGNNADTESGQAEPEESYWVKRREPIFGSRKTSVFACKHSKFSHTSLVAKAFRMKGNTSGSVTSLANDWRNEMKMLERLKHANIVKMFAWDARFYAVYLEKLPPSLDKHDSFIEQQAQTILLNVASALTYLDQQKISHNDIKPSNISWSPKDGGLAKVLDFGLATSGDDVPANAGGTRWYVPPEVIDRAGKPRPTNGNVWALGITMLWVLGKIVMPEKYEGKSWDFFDMYDPAGENREAMEDWIEEVLGVAQNLNKHDPLEYVVSLMVDQMLERRLNAWEIEPTLKQELEEQLENRSRGQPEEQGGEQPKGQEGEQRDEQMEEQMEEQEDEQMGK